MSLLSIIPLFITAGNCFKPIVNDYNRYNQHIFTYFCSGYKIEQKCVCFLSMKMAYFSHISNFKNKVLPIFIYDNYQPYLFVKQKTSFIHKIIKENVYVKSMFIEIQTEYSDMHIISTLGWLTHVYVFMTSLGYMPRNQDERRKEGWEREGGRYRGQAQRHFSLSSIAESYPG